MDMMFGIHGFEVKNFNSAGIKDEINQKLKVVLSDNRIVNWIGKIDYVDGGIWTNERGDPDAFATYLLKISHEKRVYDRGTINCSLDWGSIHLDIKKNKFHKKHDKLIHLVFGALMYVLANEAKTNDQTEVYEWLTSEYVDKKILKFVKRLEKGRKKLLEELENAQPVLVLEYKTSDEYLGSDEDMELRHYLEERLDEFLLENDLGEVDGGQIGAGTMEIFCGVDDVEIAKDKIKEFLENNKLALPQKMYKENYD